jgi:hypothetical protein
MDHILTKCYKHGFLFKMVYIALFFYFFLFFYYLQLCSLVSLQRYTKALSTLQRASLVEKSRQKPNERMKVLSEVGFFAEFLSDVILSSICFPLNFESMLSVAGFENQQL